MKKNISIVVLVISLLGTILKSQNDKNISEVGVHFFTGNWQQALDKAKKENKLIFLDAYASWCGPCKKMKRNTFTDNKVGEFYNKHFINVAIDMEKGEGVMLSEKYAIASYPTLLYIKSDGKIAFKAVGYHNAEEFISVGEKVLK
jgi:thioredoxin 1